MYSAKQEQDINVQITEKFDNPSVSTRKLEKLVKTICDRFKLSKTTISIAIVGDVEIRKVNKEFLNRNYSTDVISCDLSDENRSLFELVVNGEMAVREARSRGHSSEAELALYITHGLLHNLGFDDSTKSEAEKMHNTEDDILQQFGYGLVYNS